MDKDQIAEILSEIGTLLDLKGEPVFKSRAGSNAARTIENLTEPLDKVLAENRLGELRGIGEALQEKIVELARAGRLPYYEELRASIPPGVLAMLRIPGLGPKKVKVLHQQLGIASVEELEQACRDGKVAQLAGFGEKTQANICAGIGRPRSYAERHLLLTAWVLSDPILEALRSHPDVSHSVQHGGESAALERSGR